MIEQFAFHVIKTNIIAALFIVITLTLARLIRGKYSSMWKYFMWLMISLFLLIPVNPLNHSSPLTLEINPPDILVSKNTVENNSSLPEHTGDSHITAVSGIVSTTFSEQAVPVDSAPVSGQSKVHPGSAGHTFTLASSKISLYGFLQFFAVIWLAGAVILAACKTVLYRLSLGNLMRWSLPVSNPGLLKLYRYCCTKKHIVRPPQLLINPNISTPILAGIRTPRLYLPSEDYSFEELQLVFFHELSHYKCHDLWYKMLLLVITTIYWFNPLLYSMGKEAERDIENLCDSSVMSSCQEQKLYNRLLLRTAAFQNHVPYLSTSLNDSTLVFKERILYMMNPASHNQKLTPALLLTAALVLTGTFFGCSIGNAAVVPKDFSGSANPFIRTARTSETEPQATADTPSASRLHSANRPAGTVPIADFSTQAETVTPVSRTLYATANLNIRKDSSTNAEILTGVPRDTPLSQTGVCQNGWIQVSWNGTTAYVSPDYVTETVPVPAESPSEEDQTSNISDTQTDNHAAAVQTPDDPVSSPENGSTGTSTSGQYTYTPGVPIDADHIPDVSAGVAYRERFGIILTVDGTSFELQNSDGSTTWYWYSPETIASQPILMPDGVSGMIPGKTAFIRYWKSNNEAIWFYSY